MPTWFLLTLLLFVVVGFWIMNAFYYRNLKDEQRYKREQWAKLRAQESATQQE